jgi:hypothetical protein
MFLYHWTTFKEAFKIISKNKMKKRKWNHFIDDENQLLSGISFGFSVDKWKADHNVCLVFNLEELTKNFKHYLINGNKTYLKTQGIINPDFDPKAWIFEDDKIDECFIVENIENINSYIVKVLVKELNDD